MTARAPRASKPGMDLVSVLVPRSALTATVTPVCVTQRTSLDVLGLDKRLFLALAAEYEAAGGIVHRIGDRTVMLEIEPLRAWLARRNRAVVQAVEPTDPIDEAERALEAKLGLVRHG